MRKTISIFLTALTLSSAGITAAGAACFGDDHQAMITCGDGTEWNADTQKCVPVAS